MGDQTISLAGLIEALQMNAGMVKAESIKTSDLGFFYPDAPISWGSTNMFVYDGKTYYRDAHTFTTRLKNLCSVKNWKNVKAVVEACFMGTATTWWNITIDQDRRLGLLAANNEDRLILALQEKFKPPPSSPSTFLPRLDTRLMTAVLVATSHYTLQMFSQQFPTVLEKMLERPAQSSMHGNTWSLRYAGVFQNDTGKQLCVFICL